AQGWRLRRDDRYPAAAAELADHWLATNPPKQGMHWTSALELAFRCLAWSHAVPLLADSAFATRDRLARVAESVLVQMDHVAWNLSTWFSPNTHLTGEALALYVTGCAWPALPGAHDRRALGWRVLTEELLRQLRPDGSYFEQTLWYQGYTIDFYAEAIRWAAAMDDAIPPAQPSPSRMARCSCREPRASRRSRGRMAPRVPPWRGGSPARARPLPRTSAGASWPVLAASS
ncbi:MAG: hypothetical protein MUE41_18045, partial [Gemmatimonadaceae bacterium]|nr:hypothetical protein [Gemmatimonadaceae bacterium]